ncbi:MAG: YbjQ family protein [Desulfococcaceae bacterium]
MDALINLIIFLILMACGFFVGRWLEGRHFRSILKREEATLATPAVTLRRPDADPMDVVRAELVCGNVVISIDYFKMILASLRTLFGGRIKSYESLVDRARREAVLRMKESAPWAHQIINVRLETSTIGQSAGKKGPGSVEVLAYGTALTLRKK